MNNQLRELVWIFMAITLVTCTMVAGAALGAMLVLNSAAVGEVSSPLPNSRERYGGSAAAGGDLLKNLRHGMAGFSESEVTNE